MEVIGIICEYNPFHNGHLYHLKKIKELYPDSLIVLVLNGYFLERGEISLISKKNKTEIALFYGVDLVVELPFVYGTQSADIFASKSIDILNKLNVKKIIFGSESNNIQNIKDIALLQLNNKEEFDQNVKFYLSNGENYPTAMAKALNVEFEFKPNDLLGISYVKRIMEKKYKIEPLTIKRTNDFLDISSNDFIVSASNIREKLRNNIDISPYLPKKSQNLLERIDEKLFFNLIKYKIITEHDLSIYLDVDEGIENRLKKAINEANNIQELIKKIKTKRYTYNKISRMLIHILIGLTKEDNKNMELNYIKILGFNSKGRDYLNKQKDLKISIDKNSKIYQYELISASIYDLLTKQNNLDFELSTKPIIKDFI